MLYVRFDDWGLGVGDADVRQPDLNKLNSAYGTICLNGAMIGTSRALSTNTLYYHP
jgi:hypothetical protein